MMLSKRIKMRTSNAHKISLCIFAQFFINFSNKKIRNIFKLFEQAKIFLSTLIENK